MRPQILSNTGQLQEQEPQANRELMPTVQMSSWFSWFWISCLDFGKFNGISLNRTAFFPAARMTPGWACTRCTQRESKYMTHDDLWWLMLISLACTSLKRSLWTWSCHWSVLVAWIVIATRLLLHSRLVKNSGPAFTGWKKKVRKSLSKFKAVTGQASQSIWPPCDFQLLHAHPSSLVEDIEHTKACAEHCWTI